MSERTPILLDTSAVNDDPPAGDGAPIAPARPRDKVIATVVARPRRGHYAKIAVAVAALDDRGALPPHLRPCVWDRIVTDELIRLGYKSDLPGRYAFHRFRKAKR